MKMIIWFGFVLAALSAAGNVVITEVGKKVTIECGIKGEGQSLKWSHGPGLIFSINRRHGGSSKGKSPIVSRSKPTSEGDLQIYPVEEIDAGKFTCDAAEHTLIVVSVSVHPSRDLLLGSEVSLHCRVTDPEKISKVQWTKPDGSFEDSPAVDLKHVDASHAGNWQCLVSCGDVQFRKTVSITVKVPTSKPPSNHPIPKIPGTSHFPSPNSTNDSGSTGKTNHQPGTSGLVLLGLIWWIWVAIGVGSLIVIILIIVVIVMVRRIRRKKRKLLKMSKAKKSKRTKTYCRCERQTAAPKPRQGRRREKPLALPLQPLLKE